MNQCNPEFYEILDKKEIVNTLNIDLDEIMDDLSIQIVSTGLKDILIPIKSLKALCDIKPNFAPLYDIPEEAATGTSNGALSCYLYKYGCVLEKN